MGNATAYCKIHFFIGIWPLQYSTIAPPAKFRYTAQILRIAL